MPLTPIAIKQYNAIASQNIHQQTSGTLTIGKKYIIQSLISGDNFTNVGYTSDGTPFIATGTTPTTWTNSTNVINITDSSPQMTVQPPNTIGNIQWEWADVGYFLGTLTAAFPENKTTFVMGALPNKADAFTLQRQDDNTIAMESATSGTFSDGILSNTTIEIKIYQ